jgi:acetoin utilization deacetylase AcuC-like enzyme
VIPTAFVSHPDCARHDTGWKHPDHQGRLPGLVRAVYRDMLTLHGHLLEVEASPATEEDLRLVHTDAYIERVRRASAAAAAAGQPQPFAGEVVVSGATWEAATAAVGTALTGVGAVLRGDARSAFCAARPEGFAAAAGAAGGFSVFNSVAVAARHLRERRGVDRLLVVQWGGIAPVATADLLAGDEGTRVLAVREARGPAAAGEAHVVTLPPGSDGALFAGALEAALSELLGGFQPEFVLLAAGFDPLAADPLGSLRLEPIDYHGLTRILVEVAEDVCGGRLVSVLEGGYDPPALGRAVVQHLRALRDLPPT